MNSGIYCIKNVLNGKTYIGSAVNLKGRFAIHKSNLNNKKHINQHLQSAWNRYGASSFVFSVLLYCDRENLLLYEQRAIDVCKPSYNICSVAGNTTGRIFSEESRLKMSKAAKLKRLSEDHKSKISQALAKRVCTDDTRKKLSEAGKRKSNYMSGKSQKGEDNPFYGKTHSEQTVYRLSELAKNRSKEHQAKINESLKGRAPWNKGKKGVVRLSPETRAKMSEAQKRRHEVRAVVNE